MPRPRPIVEIEKDGIKVKVYEQDFLNRVDIHEFFEKFSKRREEKRKIILEIIGVLWDIPKARERLAKVMKKYEDYLKELGIYEKVKDLLSPQLS